MKNNIIEIKDLEKTYVSKGESLTVLKDLSFSIEEGTRTAIVGSSGNGKSTLLNIISGIDTNIEFQNRILNNENYLKDQFDTSFLSEML